MRVASVSLSSDLPNVPTLSVYFSGCDINPKCAGCHNPELWDFESGFEMTEDELVKLVLKKLEILNVGWLALVGGEPLAPQNRNAVSRLSSEVKKRFPNVKVVLFSGRTKDEIVEQGLLKYVKNCDLFVLGRFDKSRETGSFPASSNQQVLRAEEMIQ